MHLEKYSPTSKFKLSTFQLSGMLARYISIVSVLLQPLLKEWFADNNETKAESTHWPGTVKLQKEHHKSGL